MVENIQYKRVDRMPIPLNTSMIIEGDAIFALQRLPTASVQCIVTSPPYWGLRDYGISGQIGLEDTLQQYINKLVSVFSEAKRVLKDSGVFWLNIGDGYTSGNRGYRAPDKKNPARAMTVRPDTPEGLKSKDLLGIPWRLALALQEDGWYLRSDIIWNKPNAMPESVKDRPTRSHEYVFMLTKKKSTTTTTRRLKRTGEIGEPYGASIRHRLPMHILQHSLQHSLNLAYLRRQKQTSLSWTLFLDQEQSVLFANCIKDAL